jgi:hypothetical protein
MFSNCKYNKMNTHLYDNQNSNTINTNDFNKKCKCNLYLPFIKDGPCRLCYTKY